MKKSHLIFTFFIGVCVLASVVLIYSRYFYKTSRLNLGTNTKETKDYKFRKFQSQLLDFTVEIPVDYESKERFTLVEFKKANLTIGVDRNDASAYGGLDAFLLDFDEKNNIRDILHRRELEINGYPAIERVEMRGGSNSKQYYIYVDDWVYVFSTTSEELYDDLDQIVKSFRYTP